METDNIITIAHGGGGKKTQRLIKELILKHLRNPILERLDDSASLNFSTTSLAFSTDSYVVSPLFFPGADIGKLAACGTINDIVMQGAVPEYLSLGLIIEEGFLIDDLERILVSIKEVIEPAGVRIVTGDTKVVDRQKGFGIFINTSGIGRMREGVNTDVTNAREGDAVIVTGTVGEHGIAVMSCREGLEFENAIESDSAALNGLIHNLLDEIPGIHSLRDPTRGGLAAALCDIAQSSEKGIRIREKSLPVKSSVSGACRILGLDPLNSANEGKAVIICPRESAEKALKILRSHPLGSEAAIIGSVTREDPAMVILETASGGERIVEIPNGEELPRIC